MMIATREPSIELGSRSGHVALLLGRAHESNRTGAGTMMVGGRLPPMMIGVA